MNYIECEIKEDCGYLLPLGDCHIGDKAFHQNIKKLKDYIKWVKETPNARVVLGGDIFNVATRNSATPPFDSIPGEFELAVELFTPIKEKIVAAISGNHEHRTEDIADINLMQHFCFRLGIPFMGYSGVVVFKVNKRKGNRYRQNYSVYFHHGTGGGSTPGSKLNRAVKLSEIVEGCDVYCVFHSHGLSASPKEIYYPSMDAKKMLKRRRWYVVCGSYLEWANSYAEKKMLSPEKLGSPRIRFSGKADKPDIHVSI